MRTYVYIEEIFDYLFVKDKIKNYWNYFKNSFKSTTLSNISYILTEQRNSLDRVVNANDDGVESYSFIETRVYIPKNSYELNCVPLTHRTIKNTYKLP